MRVDALGVAAALGWVMASATAATAGPWPKQPGEGQAIITLTYDEATQAFDADGDDGLPTIFRKAEISAFLEHGLTPRVTLVARPAYQWVEVGNGVASEDALGFSATDFGARVLLARPLGGVVSAQAVAEIAGETENVTDARFGDGGGGAEARLLAGRSWGDEARNLFVDAQAGYRWRSDERDPDEIRVDLTAGARPNSTWLFLGQLQSTWSAEEPRVFREFESHKAQLSAVRDLTSHLSLQTGVFHTYAGKNIVEENAAFVALWVKY